MESSAPDGRSGRAMLRSAWRAFKSLQMGIFLLCLVGLACVYGTVIFGANARLGDNAIPLAKARVFNAWWFFILLAVFFGQFVISTWHVTRMSLSIWWKRDFSRSRGYLTMAGPGRASVAVPGGPETVERLLAGRFTRAHREGNRFFAHSGLRQRIGPTIIHAGIVVILVAGLVRFLLYQAGYIVSDGRFIATEGETTSIIYLPKFDDAAMSPENSQAVQLPVEITVLDFDEVFHPNSRNPAYYSSLLEVRDPRTGVVEVIKLDMNHSARIAGFEFHQASYVKLPIGQTWRVNYDVRDARTGERIAVTDASPETRVQVGDEDLFLEVDGELPGLGWRLFTGANPRTPIETGTLLARSEARRLTFALQEFYPQFAFAAGTGAYSLSNEPLDPALEVEVFVNGTSIGRTLLFQDDEKQQIVPPLLEDVEIRLADIHVRQAGEHWDFEGLDWRNPALAFFEFEVRRRGGEFEVLGTRMAAFNVPSDPMDLPAVVATQEPPPGARFAVYPLGRTERHTTVLSVVREPVVPWYVLGAGLMTFGAMLTFSGRYRAFHGMWDEEEGRLHFALVPRFGREPDPAEFAALLAELEGTAPTAREESESLEVAAR
ncbi:MAG: cytochrome c biogenesis protein ResB [Candidatus Sumerlaeia bacterium]|nr:cytochrome c biogenesis protein ResB [Candidatus Sumerlaeia bacterium]